MIVLFGDHKPWLGDNSSVYAELGIDLNYTDPEEASATITARATSSGRTMPPSRRSATPLQARDVLLGSYFLMDQLFRECGWGIPAYMQAVRACSSEVPVLSVSGLYMKDGVVTDDLGDAAELVRQFRELEYYERKHFRKEP